MLLAQKRVEETKAALAIAYQTAAHIEDKGPQVGRAVWGWQARRGLAVLRRRCCPSPGLETQGWPAPA